MEVQYDSIMPSGIQFFPARCRRQDDGLVVEFGRISARDFVDPFSDWTVKRRIGQQDVRLLAAQDLAVLSRSFVPPAGIIFHVARCGSTLVSQLLKQIQRVTVYSEPMVINDLLSPPLNIDRRALLRDIRAISALFAQHACGPYLIKLRSWNTLFCNLVVEAFPDVPWVFCTRNPLEVAVSVERKPPTWLRAFGPIDNPFLPYIGDIGDFETTTREEYIARMLAAFHIRISTLDPRLGTIVDYSELPDATWERIATKIGLPPSAMDRSRMIDVARLYSKSPHDEPLFFTDDRSDKQSSASQAMRTAIRTHALPVWQSMVSASKVDERK